MSIESCPVEDGVEMVTVKITAPRGHWEDWVHDLMWLERSECPLPWGIRGPDGLFDLARDLDGLLFAPRALGPEEELRYESGV